VEHGQEIVGTVEVRQPRLGGRVVAGEQNAEQSRVDAVQLAQEASESWSQARERRPAEQRPSGEERVGEDAEIPVSEARLRDRYGHPRPDDVEQAGVSDDAGAVGDAHDEISDEEGRVVQSPAERADDLPGEFREMPGEGCSSPLLGRLGHAVQLQPRELSTRR
jgi:hypothetical protein